jgi:hypothetical protein
MSRDNTSCGINLDDMMDPNISENEFASPEGKDDSGKKMQDLKEDSDSGSGSGEEEEENV